MIDHCTKIISTAATTIFLSTMMLNLTFVDLLVSNNFQRIINKGNNENELQLKKSINDIIV